MGFVGLCLLVGAADGAIVAGVPAPWYWSLDRPPLSAPPRVFAAAWSALYPLVGVAGWLAWRRALSTRPLRLWGWQLAATAAWTPAFFALQRPLLALAVSAALLVLTTRTMRAFARFRPVSAWLMTPHLVWSVYTAWLAAGFWWLNPG